MGSLVPLLCLYWIMNGCHPFCFCVFEFRIEQKYHYVYNHSHIHITTTSTWNHCKVCIPTSIVEKIIEKEKNGTTSIDIYCVCIFLFKQIGQFTMSGILRWVKKHKMTLLFCNLFVSIVIIRLLLSCLYTLKSNISVFDMITRSIAYNQI